MSADEFHSFEEFWPYYVREHANATNRRLHFAGTAAALAALATGLLTGRARWLLLAPLLGYGPAWIGHFVVEGNRPATFRHPLWSLRGDLRMFARMLAGTMDAEVAQALRTQQGSAHAHGNGAGNGAGNGRALDEITIDVEPAPSDPHSIN